MSEPLFDVPPGAAADHASSGSTETSLQLLRRARAGDRDALDQLFARHLPRLKRWAHGRLPRRSRDRGDTTDVVHDAAMNVFERLDRFEPRHRGALQAYLRQAVLNRIRDEHRRVMRRPEAVELAPDLADDRIASPIDEAIGAETAARYRQALASLRPHDAQAVVARIEMGYSYEQVALLLDKPSPDAARVAVSRALVRLATLMGEATGPRG